MVRCRLSARQQLLDLSRSSVYYVARDLPERDLKLMRILDELHLKWPFYGSRKLTRELQDQGHEVGRRHVTTLMRRMGMESDLPQAAYEHPGAIICESIPYLLTGLKIERPNHVWAADLTYLPMAHGFQYLVAIIDVGSRKTLSWRVSNTMTPDFCVEALQEALEKIRQAANLQYGSRVSVYMRGMDRHDQRPLVSRSAWTARVAGSTTCSSNGCGAASSTKISTFVPTRTERSCGEV